MENSDNETWHNTNAVVSEQDLADTYFPAFMSCANRGKASGVMCSYNAVNGSSALSLCMSPHSCLCAAAVDIREMVNGSTTQDIIPFSEATLNPG